MSQGYITTLDLEVIMRRGQKNGNNDLDQGCKICTLPATHSLRDFSHELIYFN